MTGIRISTDEATLRARDEVRAALQTGLLRYEPQLGLLGIQASLKRMSHGDENMLVRCTIGALTNRRSFHASAEAYGASFAVRDAMEGLRSQLDRHLDIRREMRARSLARRAGAEV